MGAAPISFGLLWAVHISDGVLSAPWLAGGFLVAGLLALVAAYRVRDEEIPRIALLSAAFFVATLMHLRLGPTSVHLLLNGLVGVVLGRRAPLAILIGLGLQAALLGHGGFYTIGVNTCVMTFPALLAAALFTALRRLPGFGPNRTAVTWLCGCILGMTAVLATLILDATVLIWGGAEDWHQIVWLVFYAHLPIVALEGVVLGFTVSFLVRVKPEMLGVREKTSRAEHGRPCSPMALEDSSCSTTTAASSSLPAVLLAICALFLTANRSYAHRLQADYFLLADRRVRIESYFDDNSSPRSATIKVRRLDGRLLAEGRLDEKGCFVFAFDEAESLAVTINAGAGHQKSFLIPRERLEYLGAIRDIPESVADLPIRARETSDSLREQLKDALIGISFLLSLAAFVLSWRTSRRIRRNGKET